MSDPHPAIARLRAWDPTTSKLRKSTRTFAPTRPKSKNKAREMPIQARLVVALRKRLPDGSLVWHTFNRRKDRQEAIYAKMMGALAGIPDVFVLIPQRSTDGLNCPFCGRVRPEHTSMCGLRDLESVRLLAIECKAPRGTPSEAQKYIRAQLEALGVPYYVARDVDAALEWIAQFVPLKPKKETGNGA